MSVEIFLQQAREEGRNFLFEYEAKEFLEKEGIFVAPAYKVESLEDARARSLQLGFPVVLKVASAKALHKSDLGGVKLNLKNLTEVEKAYRELVSLLRALQGLDEGIITIQRMEPPGVEVIAGMQRTLSFGPVLMFGLGGIFVELFKDVSFRMIPLTREDAREMIDTIKARALLEGYRGSQGADKEALVDLLLNLSRISWENDWIKEMDLNPVILYPQGYKVVDARIVI